jgi:exonuclease III
VLSVVSVYTPQAGSSMEEKVEFYSMLRKVVMAIRSNEKLVLCGDFNGHVGR